MRTLLHAAACLAVALALYRPGLGLGFVGDDVAFLHPRADWLRAAILPGGDWHYYPVTNLSFALLGRLSGLDPWPLHLLEVVLHAAVGLGVSLLLARFGFGPWTRLLAALFFVTRGIHYEVALWITELSYVIVAILSLLTLVWWDRYLRGGGRRWLAWTALGFAVAVFTIEPALLLAPLYALYDLLLGRFGRPASARDPATTRWTTLAPSRLVRDARKYVPVALIAVAFLGIKRANAAGLLWSSVAASQEAAPAPIPSGMEVETRPSLDRTWRGNLNTARRAWLDLLSAFHFLVLPTAWTAGADDNLLVRHPWVWLVPWLALHALILWRGPPLARFLLAWVYLYELPLALGSVPQARYQYFASMPASALVAIGVAALVRRIGSPAARRLAVAAVAVLAIGIGLGEARFIRARIAEWTLASDLVRATAGELRRLPAEVTSAVLVNLPRGVPGPYWTAYAFANAAEFLPLMMKPPRPELEVRAVYDRTFVAGHWPTIGRFASRASIEAEAAKPGTVVYEFTGAPPWFRRLAPRGRVSPRSSPATRRAPRPACDRAGSRRSTRYRVRSRRDRRPGR